MIPKSVAEFRADYRSKNLSGFYSGVGHLCFTSFVWLGVVALCVANLRHVTALQWLTVPLTFVYSNFSEFKGHSGPMHHKTKGFGLIFRRHALEHHNYFTHDAMACETTRDYKMILFPPIMTLFFFGLFGFPIWLLVYYIFLMNVALLFAITSIGYFLNYEWLHLMYHLPEESRITRLPLLKQLKHHHMVHHNKQLMSNYNFNITYPICDWLFGTTYKEKAVLQPAIK